MFGRCYTPSARPSSLMFLIDHSIARIPRSGSFTLAKAGCKLCLLLPGGSWQQQRCDSLHCHEEWWCSVPQSVVVFSWANDEYGAARTCSITQRIQSAFEVQHGAVLPHQCNTPQWTLCREQFLSMKRTGMLPFIYWRFKFCSYERAQVSSIVTIRPRKS